MNVLYMYKVLLRIMSILSVLINYTFGKWSNSNVPIVQPDNVFQGRKIKV